MINSTQIQEKLKSGTLKCNERDLNEAYYISQQISEFVPCEVFASLYENSDDHVQRFECVILNDICGQILVNWREKSGYIFYCPNTSKLPYMDYLSIGTIGKRLPEQNKIFKPTKKKVDFEIDRLEKIYLQSVEQSKRKEQEIKYFYSKIEALGGKHDKRENSGYIDFKHYELKYCVHNDGYISQELRLKYTGSAIDFLLTQK